MLAQGKNAGRGDTVGGTFIRSTKNPFAQNGGLHVGAVPPADIALSIINNFVASQAPYCSVYRFDRVDVKQRNIPAR